MLFSLAIGQYVTGYRLSADDVLFHQTLMDGWATSWEFIKAVSFAQGRIVHFLDLPFSLLGAYYADDLYFRIFYTALYFSNFALVGIYASRVSETDLTKIIVLILLAFHPLDYFHLPPNSYSFHTSIPVFLITASRIMVLKARSENSPREFYWLGICFLGMMFSEYGFVYALTLILCEAIARIASCHEKTRKPLSIILLNLMHRDFLKDAFLIALFLGLYFGFRIAHPSNYEGNQLSQQFSGMAFLKTLFGHMYGGTSLPALSRNSGKIVSTLHDMKTMHWLTGLSVFALTFFLTSHSIRQYQKSFPLSEALQRRLLLTACLGLVSAILITAPVALTGKYQAWCQDINTCVFLDSRISYLGVGVSLAGFSLLIPTWLRSVLSTKASTLLVSLVISIGAGVTWIHNLHIQRDMKDFVSAWERAKIASCLSIEQLKQVRLTEKIDPSRRIKHHHDFDMEEYWEKYLKDQNEKINCGVNTGKLRDFYPRIALGKRLFTGRSGGGVPLLKHGWSQPEAWGTWTEGPTATIEIPLGTPTPQLIQFEANVLLSPTHVKQDVDVLVNGIRSAQIRLTAESQGRFEIQVPPAALATSDGDHPLRLEFHLPDAMSPKDIGRGEDSRRLAIGLISLTLR